MSDVQENGFHLTGRHVLFAMLGFFAVIIAVNFYMATLASSSWTGLVVRNSYVASQKFNGDLANAAAQNALGWRSDLAYDAGKLSFQLKDADGTPLAVDNLQVSIGRPAFEQQDQMLTLNLQADSLYSAPVVLKAGDWAVQIIASVAGKPYRRDARIFVGENGKGRVE